MPFIGARHSAAALDDAAMPFGEPCSVAAQPRTAMIFLGVRHSLTAIEHATPRGERHSSATTCSSDPVGLQTAGPRGFAAIGIAAREATTP